MLNESTISTIVSGINSGLSDAALERVNATVRNVSKTLEEARTNRNSNAFLSSGRGQSTQNNASTAADTEAFTTISEMINGNTRDFAGFGTLLDSLYAKNKKYFTIIKDYEIMPILIPQINRVLNFLVDESLTPDIQNETTFSIRYTGNDSGAKRLQEQIDSIKTEMKLDPLLRDVYMNRYKLGREMYMVQDYQQTFDRMLDMLNKKKMNEDTAGMTDVDYINSVYSSLTETINDLSVNFSTSIVSENPRRNRLNEEVTDLTEAVIDVTLPKLNIVIERSPIVKLLEDAEAELISESYKSYSLKNMFDQKPSGNLNEDATSVVDTSKLEQLVMNMQKKKLQRCTIVRFDPARMFKLKVGGKVIGYFYVTDINENTANVVNFAQSLKDQLMKSRAVNLTAAAQSAEEVISKELAQRIINTFDPNLGINRVEDIDLMHDFIRNNEIYKGNKRITFYYADEIYDMSRADESLLTNAVFFTKLYATLLLNNVITKVLRGRGRQIHTVQMGVSSNMQRYIDNAMASLAMPEHNLGTLHGSFEQIFNPFNGSSDIILPTEDTSQEYIKTDYIPGQDVNMDDEFLKTLLNSIVTSFNLDSAVLDATNGNLQFARTLTMESLQISNFIRNEQQDLHPAWEAMCLEVLRIMGDDDLKLAVEQKKVEVTFYEPKTLIIANTIDDLNNAKTLAENVADIIPELNEEESDAKRNRFIYRVVKEKTNMDFSVFEDALAEAEIEMMDDQMLADIRKIVREYQENTREETYGDTTGDGIPNEGGSGANVTGEYGEDEGELTPEEQEIMNTPDEEEEEEDLGDENI